MKKVESKVFKGIEYIQLGELPDHQREELVRTLNPELFIKIMIDKKVVSQCVQYKDYVSWFDSVYNSSNSRLQKNKSAQHPVVLEVK